MGEGGSVGKGAGSRRVAGGVNGLGILCCALVAAAVIAVLHRRYDGRLRQTRAVARRLADVGRPGQPGGAGSAENARGPEGAGPSGDVALDVRTLLPAAGERATLLQFSTAFCAPCRATKRTLADVAAVVPGVQHVEIDAESNLELVRLLGILKTPTTLILDADGREVLRASGQPKKEDVLAALVGAVGPGQSGPGQSGKAVPS